MVYLEGGAVLEPGERGRGDGVGLALQSHLSAPQHRHVLGGALPRDVGGDYTQKHTHNTTHTHAHNIRMTLIDGRDYTEKHTSGSTRTTQHTHIRINTHNTTHTHQDYS